MRAWAVDNGFPHIAHQRGSLPADVREAYWVAHPDEAVRLTVVETPAGEEETVAGDEFSVSVVIAGCDTTDIQAHLVEAIWAAFLQGRVAERRDMLAQLGGTQ